MYGRLLKVETEVIDILIFFAKFVEGSRHAPKFTIWCNQVPVLVHKLLKGVSYGTLPFSSVYLGRRASIKAIEVSNSSITPTTANRFSRLNIASCSAVLLFGSPHSMLRKSVKDDL